MNISMLVAASAGLLSFLSPCVLPLVPSYLAFVAGASFGDLRGRPDRAVRKVVVLNALGFILGFSLVFITMGAAVTLLGGGLIGYRGIVQKVGGALIILFGLYLIGILRLPFLMRPFHVSLSSKPVGLLGSIAVGVTFGAGWTPCVGPILGAILSLAHALGETAPLLMIGMVSFVPGVPEGFTGAATVLPVQVFIWENASERAFHERTAGAIIVLLVFMIVMNAAAVILRRRFDAGSWTDQESLDPFRALRPCLACRGERVRPESRAVRVKGRRLVDYVGVPIAEALPRFPPG